MTESKALAESIIAALSAHAADAARLQQQEQEIARLQQENQWAGHHPWCASYKLHRNGPGWPTPMGGMVSDPCDCGWELLCQQTTRADAKPADPQRIQELRKAKEAAEADNAALRAQVETLTRERDEEIADRQMSSDAAEQALKENVALRKDLSTLRDQLAQQSKAARALADKVDATSECDHSRRACEDIGCIGAEVKAVRAVLASLDTETK